MTLITTNVGGTCFLTFHVTLSVLLKFSKLRNTTYNLDFLLVKNVVRSYAAEIGSKNFKNI